MISASSLEDKVFLPPPDDICISSHQHPSPATLPQTPPTPKFMACRDSSADSRVPLANQAQGPLYLESLSQSCYPPPGSRTAGMAGMGSIPATSGGAELGPFRLGVFCSPEMRLKLCWWFEMKLFLSSPSKPLWTLMVFIMDKPWQEKEVQRHSDRDCLFLPVTPLDIHCHYPHEHWDPPAKQWSLLQDFQED